MFTGASKPTVVLVHGAWADGSSWHHVIPLLEKDGYTTVAVQNPLTSLAADVANTKRVLEDQKGPVVIAAHSFGGAAMTGAATGSEKVKALVYIAGFAPDQGESLSALIGRYPAAALAQAIQPDPAGYLYIDRAKFHDVFCQDVDDEETTVLEATQKPPLATVFGDQSGEPAWRTIPSWYLVSQDDQAINPSLERYMAQRMGAMMSEVKASHVAMISQPRVVADLIEKAATATVH